MSLFDTGIRPQLDQWLLDKSKEVRDYGDYWSASSAGYCQRKVIFERLGVPHVETEADARKQRVFTAGHLFHDWIQGITKESGLSIASELELQDETLMIRGHFDDLIKVDDNVILYDYKTQNSRAFTYQKNQAMSYFHKMQLGTYLLMMKDRPTEARILYISKDDLRMEEKQLLWSDELEKEVLEYWNTLNAHWEKKTLPSCTCADHSGGFMAKEKFNPFFYNGEPCSLEWYSLQKKNGNLK